MSFWLKPPCCLLVYSQYPVRIRIRVTVRVTVTVKVRVRVRVSLALQHLGLRGPHRAALNRLMRLSTCRDLGS